MEFFIPKKHKIRYIFEVLCLLLFLITSLNLFIASRQITHRDVVILELSQHIVELDRDLGECRDDK